MRTNVEYMLAVRTARHDRGSRAAVMMRIASLSTALGIAVMILTLAVVAGFRHEISDDLRGLAGDIQVIDVSGWGRSDSDPMPLSDSLLERLRRSEHVLSVAPYAVAGCMVKSGDRVAGLRFKGVGDGFDEAWWRAKLVEGELPDVRSAERRKELLISRATARSLRVGVGDKIEALFLDEGDAPHRDRYKVAGIYHTGFEELDGVMAVADLRDVRKSASWGDDEITGYEIALDDPSRADAAAERIDALLEDAFYDGDEIAGECVAATLEMRYPVIYDWLKAHGVNARVIIFIMTVVAVQHGLGDAYRGARPHGHDRHAESRGHAQRGHPPNIPVARGDALRARRGVGQRGRAGAGGGAGGVPSRDAQPVGLHALGVARARGAVVVGGAQRGRAGRDGGGYVAAVDDRGANKSRGVFEV